MIAKVSVTHEKLNLSPIAEDAPGNGKPVQAVAFSPDGRMLAGGTANGAVLLWHVGSNGQLTGQVTLRGPSQQPVIGVSFSGDGDLLAASDADHTISLWNVHDPGAPSLFATLTGLATATPVAFLPPGRILAGAAWDGTVRYWNTKPDEVADEICAAGPASFTRTLPGLGVTDRPACPASG